MQTENQPQPAVLTFRDPGIRQIMREAAYQLAKELREYIELSELRYQTLTHDKFEHVRSLPPIEDSVRSGFNSTYDSRYQALVTFFIQFDDQRHTDVAQFGTLHVQERSMPYTEAVKIIKARIGWLLINADEMQI
ncbi:hypothetical protein [Spirosoma validum]|uniref:Uncharacterized protein n=1 Tax=Spirosoma validum TaxID=2771355 RepID=A0A927GDN3_9BACT|nr:hypothetical protein [Spirosoma validum]MBD2753730.1 hypothetical protein [Spirosoma validum]